MKSVSNRIARRPMHQAWNLLDFAVVQQIMDEVETPVVEKVEYVLNEIADQVRSDLDFDHGLIRLVLSAPR